MRDTKIIELLAGPGAGKSSLAHHLMSEFKDKGASVEYVPEFAKELTWAGRTTCLGCQPYIMGEQYRRVYDLLGKVDFIVTDSPIILGILYNKGPKSMNAYLADLYKELPNVNYFVNRRKKYITEGRNQTEAQARTLDEAIRRVLNHYQIQYEEVFSTKAAALQIVRGVTNE